MRFSRSLMFCAAAALIGAGCEVHERDHGYVGVGVSADVAVDEPQGAVIQGPGVVAIDVEPDPSARTYVYDEGYPPGTYLYDNYYYYGGYRYPRDVFVNQYVQENVRQHRFVNKDQNRQQAVQIEQRHRTEFAQTHGVRKSQPVQRSPQPAQTPARQPEAPRANIERPENRTPAEEHRPAVQQPEKKTPANEERRPEVKTPANEERRPAEDKTPGKVERPENKVKPANEPREPNREEPKREEAK